MSLSVAGEGAVQFSTRRFHCRSRCVKVVEPPNEATAARCPQLRLPLAREPVPRHTLDARGVVRAHALVDVILQRRGDAQVLTPAVKAVSISVIYLTNNSHALSNDAVQVLSRSSTVRESNVTRRVEDLVTLLSAPTQRSKVCIDVVNLSDLALRQSDCNSHANFYRITGGY